MSQLTAVVVVFFAGTHVIEHVEDAAVSGVVHSLVTGDEDGQRPWAV